MKFVGSVTHLSLEMRQVHHLLRRLRIDKLLRGHDVLSSRVSSTRQLLDRERERL